MVRSWLTLKVEGGSRLKAITMWGFDTTYPWDIMMVTPELQPRPQFAAFAVMANQTADATYVADHSKGNVATYEWTRTDGPMFTVWAKSGKGSVTFEAPAGKLTVMDLMGNRSVVKAKNGIASMNVTPSPVYVFERRQRDEDVSTGRGDVVQRVAPRGQE